MKRQIIIVGVLALAFMLPLVTTAAVIVNNDISVSLHDTNTNQVYLAAGPGYTAANSSNFFGIMGNQSSNTNMSLYINTIPGSGNVTLTNVLEVENTTTSTSPVYFYLNGTLPVGVTVYFSSTPITYNGFTPSGTAILWNDGSGNAHTTSNVHITKRGAAGYFAFVLSGTSASSSASLNFQYSVG